MPRFVKYMAVVIVFAVVAAIAWNVYRTRAERLPDGIVSSNGRLEAQEIDISTKLPGRVVDVLVDEGDSVTEGQVLAHMDTRELEAQLAQAEAEIARGEQTRIQAQADVVKSESECTYAERELKRALTLSEKGHVSTETVDRRLTAKQSADANCNAAKAQLGAADASLDVARAKKREIEANIEDATLRAPRPGRILYRLAEPGEVLGAGGRVLVMVDLSDTYMTLFLPTEEAGRVGIGAEARIVLDAFPDRPVAARISYVSDKAQFTPKEVETSLERQKLMFRVKAEVIAPAPLLKPGMPGVAYVRTEGAAEWPDNLK